jgi:CubicO group peptidase (beta-lactamase class C family)
MDQQRLQRTLDRLARDLGIPGAATGVHHGGSETVAFHGVTSVENPLPVDDGTIFQAGSIGKTYTATALLCLVERGDVELEAPVRRYVPELRLGDEDVARRATVAHLLDHTAGWEGDLFDDTGEGDDALARYVERMARLRQVTPLGSAVAYNNASLALAGRVVEKVTGSTYEQAVQDLLFVPLGLENSFFFCNDVMTRRFCVGHTPGPDRALQVARPWAFPRGGAPSGAIACPVGDLLAWARFHLGDGRTADGTRILDGELLHRMRHPRAEIAGGGLGDYVGLSWFLRDVGGQRVVSHDGSTNGQLARLVLVPARGWAVAVMTNCAPAGHELIDGLTRWALHEDLDLEDREPEPVELTEQELARYAGEYESIALRCRVTVADGGLIVEPVADPEAADAGEEVAAGLPALRVGILPLPGDRYVVTDGPVKGMKGCFSRGADGEIDALNAGGRLLTRVR